MGVGHTLLYILLENQMKIVKFLCFLFILISAPAFSDGLKVVNSKEWGYLLKVPNDWMMDRHWRGNGSTVISQNRTAGVTIQIRDMRSGERFEVAKFKNNLTQKFSEFPDSVFHSYKDGVSVYDYEIGVNERNKLVRYQIRLMCYTQEKVALIIEGKCTASLDQAECDQVKSIIDSFWVYNKHKFSAIFANYR